MRIKITTLCILLCFLMQLSIAEVNMWEDELNLPTWEIGPPETNPAFPYTFANHRIGNDIYPYPYKETITSNKVDKTYKACWLENEFIRVLITPEIGGKLYGAKDKTNDYNFFYWHPTVKPALISTTGAWVSGGIEWNFPKGHRPSTFSPVSYTLAENRDGSKTVWVGETEWVYGMRWIVGMTIYPGKSVIEAKVRLLNPTSLPHSYYMWATTATNTNDNYQLIYPTRLMTGHGKFKFFNWPIDNEVDISWWKNVPNASSYFSMELGEFFGGYDHGKQAGTVLTGNKHIAIGKKFWTWGTSPSGRMWDWILSDGEGPYAEPQMGVYADNQPDYHWLQAGEVKSFSLYFYPVRDIGSSKQANVNGALNLEFNKDEVIIGAYSTGILDPGIVRLQQDGKTIFEKKLRIDPSKPFVHQLLLENASNHPENFTLSMLDAKGGELVIYTPKLLEKLSFPEPTKVYDDPTTVKSNDELWHAGETLAKYRDPDVARQFFMELLTRDSLNSRAHLSLAELDIKCANYPEALEHLDIAVKHDTDNGKLFYLRAVAEEASGKYELAYNHYFRSIHFPGYLSRAYERVARLDLRHGDYKKALQHIQNAIESNKLNPQLWSLKATALRLNGQLPEAEQAANKALQLDPLHLWSTNELRLVRKNHENSNLTRLLLDDYQNYIELAMEYLRAGLYQDAYDVLKLAETQPVNYMTLINYYAGYCMDQMDKKEEASQLFKAGKEQSVEYIFPFRRKALDVFNTALKYDPKDARAHYYLGMVYAGILNGKYAMAHWQKAVEMEPENPKALRNMGLLKAGYPDIDKNLQQAKKYYEKALGNAPSDSRILWELDKVRQWLGDDPQSRLSLLQKHTHVVETRDDLLTSMLDLLVQHGQYEEALQYFQTHTFNNWEGRYSIHNAYMEACIGVAKSTESQEAALDWYLKACEYPRNLRVAPREPNLRGFLYYPMARLYQKIGNQSEADRLLKITSDESTKTPTMVNFYQAMALRDLGDVKKEKALIQALKEEGQNLIEGKSEGYHEKGAAFKKALGIYYLSKVYEAKGNSDDSHTKLEEARKLFPLIEREALMLAQMSFAGANQ